MWVELLIPIMPISLNVEETLVEEKLDNLIAIWLTNDEEHRIIMSTLTISLTVMLYTGRKTLAFPKQYLTDYPNISVL